MLSSRVLRFAKPQGVEPRCLLADRHALRATTLSQSVMKRKQGTKLGKQFLESWSIKRVFRFYATSFESRLAERSAPKKQENAYANRERGDLSEYRHQLHSLSMSTGGRDLEVLRAWDEGRMSDVLDACDDVIESRAYELDEVLNSGGPTITDDEARHRQAADLTHYIFHRNVKASALNSMGRWRDALRVSEETIRLTKHKDRDALCLRGTALNGLGNLETPEKALEHNMEALKCFESALALLPAESFDLEASLNCSTILFKLGRANEALERAQAALNHLVVKKAATNSVASNDDPFADDSDPFANSDVIQAQSQPGEEFDPIAYRQAGLDRAHIKFDPDLHILVAAIYATTNQLESAIAQCMLGVKSLKRKGALQTPLLSRFYEIHFRACVQLNRQSEAELVAKMLTKIHPTDMGHLEKYFKMMVRCERSFEEVWAVLDSYSSKLARDANSMAILLEYKLMCQQQYGRTENSISVAEALLKLGPHPAAYHVKVLALLKDNKAQKALEACEEARGYGIETNEILLAKALALDALQRWDEASAQFEAVIATDSAYGPAHFHYANCLARLGRNEEALVGYDRAITLEASNPPPKLLLAKAVLLRSMGKLKEAIDTYHLLSKLDPSILPDVLSLAKSFQRDNPSAFTSPELASKVQEMQTSFKYFEKMPTSPLFNPSSSL